VASGPQRKRDVETVASILERATESTIREWFARVEMEETLRSIPMSFEQRCHHLPRLFRELIVRLGSGQPIGTKELRLSSAGEHGANRSRQGYTAAMLVEESRLLQISIFHTLQQNLANIDYSVLLVAVMTIADEIDSQLRQAITRFTAEAIQGPLPAGRPNGTYAI
jgi:hypothetical protein